MRGDETTSKISLTLHANIGSETSLGDAVTDPRGIVSLLSTGQLERDSVSDDRRVTVGNVGERSGVDEDRGSLERLHDRRLDGVLHENSESTGASDVVGSDGLTSLGSGNNHLTESDCGQRKK